MLNLEFSGISSLSSFAAESDLAANFFWGGGRGGVDNYFPYEKQPMRAAIAATKILRKSRSEVNSK